MRKAAFVGFMLFSFIGSFAQARDLCTADNFLSSESWRKHQCARHWENLRKLPYKLELKQRKVLRFERNGLLKPYQFSSPVFDEGHLYFGVDGAQVYAVSANPLRKLWHVSTKGPVQSKITVADHTLYFGDTKGFAYALNAENGAELWQSKLDDAVMAEPLFLSDHVFFLTLSGRLYALDSKTGAEFWHSASFEKNWGFSVHKVSPPQAWHDLVLVGTATGMVQAFRVADGSIVWSRQIGDRQADAFDVDAKVWVGEDRLYATSVDGTLARLEPKTGTVLWTSDIGGANDLLFFDGRIFVAANNVLAALDSETGERYWEQELDAPGLSAPVAGNHFVAVASTNDALYFFLPETGDLLQRRFIKKGSFGDLVLNGDELYVLTNSSHLMAYRVKVKAVQRK